MITPSHNPPADGGFKYNPPDGGPADTDVTGVDPGARQRAARRRQRGGAADQRRAGTGGRDDARGGPGRALRARARRGASTSTRCARPGLRLGVDPLGGASLGYWPRIAERYGLDLSVVNPAIDPTFGFMTVDHDGKIRMDCSSPWAMAGLVGLKDRFAVAWGNDPDADRHGIVTPSAGLLNPNHYLAVAIDYLLDHRPAWPATARVGKTLVSSALIDRVVAALRPRADGGAGRLQVVRAGPVRRHAAASAARRARAPASSGGTGGVWTTDKDGLLLGLLAAEITAVTGRGSGRALPRAHGAARRAGLHAHRHAVHARAEGRLQAADARRRSRATTLAGDPILATLTTRPGNGAPIGGLKVTTRAGLVRGPTERHRERVQAVRGELSRRRPSRVASSRKRGRWWRGCSRRDG